MKPEYEFPASRTVVAPDILPSIQQPSSNPPSTAPLDPPETRFLRWLVIGSQGIRSGWSVAAFLILTGIFMAGLGSATTAFVHRVLHIKTGQFSPISATISETISVLAVLGAAAILARLERRRVLDYNLRGPRRWFYFASGALWGFVALSALVGVLYAGGWLRFGAAAQGGIQIVWFGFLWGIAFLLTGLFEEGGVRCYLQFTLTRGINFWWALGLIASFCLFVAINPHSQGGWGVYAMAALGVIPCLLIHLRKRSSNGFWQAAWVTSTFFGYIHTFNEGESWIGIFAAAAIGFVFCVSIRLTGSAWWAIGFHAAWDWAQTFFYGTADSGFAGVGHYLSTSPNGAVLWSGGSDGPEGSLLILPLIVVLLAALLLMYRRRTAEPVTLHTEEQLAG